MTARTIGVTAAIGMIVSVSAQADPPGGDIVDQILHPVAPPAAVPMLPPAPLQPAPPAAASPPAIVARPIPLTAPSPQPVPVAAQPAPHPAQNTIPPAAMRPPGPPPRPGPTTPQPASTLTGPDIIGEVRPAASLPAAQTLASRWQGFYFGANIGGGWDEGTSASSCTNALTNTPSGCAILSQSGPNGSGILGGAQLGYLGHLDLGTGTPLIVGIETDLQGSDISGSQQVGSPIPLVGFPPCTDCTFTANQSIDWFGSTRLRIGMPIDNLLIYATGGLMYGRLHASQLLGPSNSTGFYSAAVTTTHVGPTIGLGAELLVSGPWSVRAEGLYYDLGKIRTVAEPMNGAFVNFDNVKTFVYRGGIIRLGVDLHLGDLIF
jgi:outer membrane immunogenic protein